MGGAGEGQGPSGDRQARSEVRCCLPDVSPRETPKGLAGRAKGTETSGGGGVVGAEPALGDPGEGAQVVRGEREGRQRVPARRARRSEEQTSELQSRENLVCRLLLEKKK